MPEFRKQQLDQVANIVTGSTPSSRELDSWGDELDFITPSDQEGNSREAFPTRRLSAVGAKRLKNRIVPARSTNLTCIGSTIGKVSMARSAAVTNQQINSIIAIPGISDPDFIYYMIKNWSPTLKEHASGSATPIINKTVLSRYAFDVPGLAEQQAVAEVLGALDDKISANTKLLEQTDRMQHTIFRSMLRSSDPIPLSETACFINGKAFTKGASGTGRVVIRIAELNSGLGGSTVYSDAEVAAEHLANPGDILFAWSGSLTLHRWFRSPGIVNQHIFKVIPNDPYPHWLIYELIREKLDEFKAIAANKATTMGHIQRRHLDEEVLVPREEIWRGQSASMQNLWTHALNAEQENLTLATTRDMLLPRLMSGKLRVKDAETQIASLV